MPQTHVDPDEDLWQAVLQRDSTRRNDLLYGVRTTGIYCRPGCSARTPLRQNVRFYTSAEDAESDGLRPCLRCKPKEAQSPVVNDRAAAVRRYIRRHIAEPERLTLEALSSHFKLSPFHLQRTFKADTGITPKQYVEELRMQALKEELKAGASVTDAVYGAGFGSGSRVYERVDTCLGMTPKQYRSGGAEVAISYATMTTPLGLLMVGATDRGLCSVEFGDSPEELLLTLREEYPKATISPMQQPPGAQYTAWVRAITAFLDGEKDLGKLPAAVHGSAFQKKVWTYLQTIPSGSVQSYTEVAAGIGSPRAVRAVASACAANRIAMVVPCHRVIRGDGSLGGYRWGLQRKRLLLDAERKLRAEG